MRKIFLSTSTILMTLIALPGWATTSQIFIKSDRNLAVLSYSNSLHSISSNQVIHQKLPSNARTELVNKQILLSEKIAKNPNSQQKDAPRPSPSRGAPKPKRDRD